MMRKFIYSVVILAVVFSLGVVAPPGFVKAGTNPDYQLIIQDPDEALDDGLDLKDIYAAVVDETSLYIKGVTYGDWSSVFKFWVIFMDVDQDTNTGATDEDKVVKDNYPEGVHGIGADYAAWVGYWNYVSPWGGNQWDHNNKIYYSSYNMDDETHTFEIVIPLSGIGNPTAIDIVGYTEDFSGPYDYAPDDGYATYPINQLIEIAVDIKPGSEPNSINLGSKGVVPVAVLTTDDPEFDATTVDPETVKFADAVPKHWTSEDVDEDGDIDLLFHFKIQELNLTESSEDATLTGETFGGDKITGTDLVRIVPAKS